MTADDLRAIAARLGVSLYALAPLLGHSRRQLQRLSSGEQPISPPVRKLLMLLDQGKISLDDLRMTA